MKRRVASMRAMCARIHACVPSLHVRTRMFSPIVYCLPNNKTCCVTASFTHQLYTNHHRLKTNRAKFRVNAANRTEGFCTLQGLPSDLLVRGDVNQNRAVEGDEVAVLAFKLQDWFKVYKEQEKVIG